MKFLFAYTLFVVAATVYGDDTKATKAVEKKMQEEKTKPVENAIWPNFYAFPSYYPHPVAPTVYLNPSAVKPTVYQSPFPLKAPTVYQSPIPVKDPTVYHSPDALKAPEVYKSPDGVKTPVQMVHPAYYYPPAHAWWW